jgi:hypothetical protein
MTSLPLFFILSPNGQFLSGDQAHALISLPLRRDLTFAGLRRATAAISKEEAQDIAYIFSQSDIGHIQKWCARLLASIMPHLGTGVRYVAMQFTRDQAIITVVSHSNTTGAVPANSAAVIDIGVQQVRATVDSLCKAQGKTREQLHLHLKVREKVQRMMPVKMADGGNPGGQSNPGANGTGSSHEI